MDVLIFVICLCFGLILTLIGLRNSAIAIIALLFNLAAFTTALVDGLTEVIGYASSTAVTTTYDPYPAILLPAFFVILGVVKVVKYR